MKTLQAITTTILTLMLLVAGIAGFAPQAYACDPGQCEFALYTDQRPSGTGAQGLTRYAWNIRTINTTVIEQGSSTSRSGNEITLQPGTYYIHIIAQASSGGPFRGNQLRLRTTDNQTLAVGHSQYTWTPGGVMFELLTYLDISSTTTFRIEHYPQAPDTRYPVYGGSPVYNYEPEVYLTVHIIRVTDEKCH